jgi:hypothetical protein
LDLGSSLGLQLVSHLLGTYPSLSLLVLGPTLQIDVRSGIFLSIPEKHD